MADLEGLRIDELDELNLKLKQEQRVIKEERLAIAAARARLVNIQNIAARLGVDVADLTDEQIAAIGSIKSTPKPGDVVAEPGTLGLKAEGQGGDA